MVVVVVVVVLVVVVVVVIKPSLDFNLKKKMSGYVACTCDLNLSATEPDSLILGVH